MIFEMPGAIETTISMSSETSLAPPPGVLTPPSMATFCNVTGAMPAWLAPIQASVLNIAESSADYAREVAKALQKQGLRVESDLRNEKITYKIREHSLQKVPYILVVGDKEKANGTVSVRARGNHDLGAMPLGDFSSKLTGVIAEKA